MENSSRIYENVFKEYREIMRHHELNNLRLEIKTWLKNEREGNKNEIEYSDLIILIHSALLFKNECDDFSEMIEIASFNTNVDEFLIIEDQMLSILRQLNFYSNVNLSVCIEKINKSKKFIRNKISQSYVIRNFNDVFSELFDLDLDGMIKSNPTVIKALLNELLYLDNNESAFSKQIKNCRILLIEIIEFIKWLNETVDPNPHNYLLDDRIDNFKKNMNLLKIEISAANSTLPKAGRSWWQKLFGS
jgi:hypothetical protein